MKYLTELIVAEVEYEVELVYDTTKPYIIPRKSMNTRKINNFVVNIKLKLSAVYKKHFMNLTISPNDK